MFELCWDVAWVLCLLLWNELDGESAVAECGWVLELLLPLLQICVTLHLLQVMARRCSPPAPAQMAPLCSTA